MQEELTSPTQQLIEIMGGLSTGDLRAYDRLANDLAPKYIAVYDFVLKEYLEVKTNQYTYEIYRLRMNEIGSKSNAFKGIVNGWNNNNDQLMFSSYNDLVYTINELGKPVDDHS